MTDDDRPLIPVPSLLDHGYAPLRITIGALGETLAERCKHRRHDTEDDARGCPDGRDFRAIGFLSAPPSM
jgi:hypothetical protein